LIRKSEEVGTERSPSEPNDPQLISLTGYLRRSKWLPPVEWGCVLSEPLNAVCSKWNGLIAEVYGFPSVDLIQVISSGIG